jgi:exosortase/archaeosortase family protein
MSTAGVAVPLPGDGPFEDLRRRWDGRSPRTRTTLRLAALLGSTTAAYHYSLISLIQSLSLETPLAYVGLVPVMALLLAALRARPLKPEPVIHDRQVDYIVGIPLLVAALAVNLLMPQRLSTMFWVWRIDLFTLPFFVAGAVALLFGVRVLWRQRLAIAFLLLAWPLPYSVLLLRFLTDFTDVTLSSLRTALHVVRVATPQRSADGSLFQVVHAGKAFPISVVSACSGVNGMVGFLLVGVAFGAVVRGPRFKKALWLTAGLLLLWLVNLGRILFIFWAGKTWGESVAIDVLHPYVGLVTFNLGIIVMLVGLRPFGLSIRHSGGLATAAGKGGAALRTFAVPKAAVALATVLVLGAVLSVTNENLKSYDLVANALGGARLTSFSDHPYAPDGWSARQTDRFTWARPFFGDDSTWLRYTYSSQFGSSAPLRSSLPITGDVIRTSNLRSFSAYGVEACYKFHGYKLRDVANVALGGGVTGQALSFANPKQKLDWTVVYWIWPVKTAGASTRYERITLYLQGSGNAKLDIAGPAVKGVKSLRGGLSRTDELDRRLGDTRAFIVAFARSIVVGQKTVVPGSPLSAPVRPAVPPRPPGVSMADYLQSLRSQGLLPASGGNAPTGGPTTTVAAAGQTGSAQG